MPREYYFLPIIITILVIYLISHFLSKKGTISIKNHRRIWNILLLITFLGVGISGILLTIKVSYGLGFSNPPINILFWHVETGIAMTLISIFHIIWHWPYYKCIFKQKKENCEVPIQTSDSE